MKARSDFKEWFARPGEVDQGAHGRLCQEGYVEIQDGVYRQMMACPVCDYYKGIAREEERVRAGIEASGIGVRYYDTEWASLELPSPLPRLRTACGKLDTIIGSGQSLLLYGPPGGGKTQAAVLLVKAAVRMGYSARLENLGQLAVRIRASYDGSGRGITEEQAVRELSNVDLLVWDDLGAGEAAKGTVEERVFYLILEARQNAGRVTILTTNLNPAELTEAVGSRAMNRVQPLSMIAFKHGRNFRTEQAAALW